MSSLFPPEFRALLNGPARRYFIATFVWATGTGLTLALSLIYIQNVRHLDKSFAFELLAAIPLVGLAITPIIGTITDRIGPTRVMIVGGVVMAGGLVLYDRS